MLFRIVGLPLRATLAVPTTVLMLLMGALGAGHMGRDIREVWADWVWGNVAG